VYFPTIEIPAFKRITMSQPFQQPMPNFQPPHSHKGFPQETNGMGMAGFITSIAGIFLCGIPAVIGLPLSLMGLTKNPKGFAIAGTIISLIGLVELVLFCLFLYSTYQFAQNAKTVFSNAITSTELHECAENIAKEWERSGDVPSQAEGQKIVDRLPSFNSQDNIYETDGNSFSIRNIGIDGEAFTEDDLVIGPFESFEDAINIESEFDFDPDEDFEFNKDNEFEQESNF